MISNQRKELDDFMCDLNNDLHTVILLAKDLKKIKQQIEDHKYAFMIGDWFDFEEFLDNQDPKLKSDFQEAFNYLYPKSKD